MAWVPFRCRIKAHSANGIERQSAMKVFRSPCSRLGRVLLVSALMPSVLVKSAVGDVLVLHQHGLRRAHLHVLGSGDFLSAAASSRFGHSPLTQPLLQSASQNVRVLAVVAIGSVFVFGPHGSGIAEVGLLSLQNGPLVLSTGLQEAPIINSPQFSLPAQFGRTASAVLLLRNHTLLL